MGAQTVLNALADFWECVPHIGLYYPAFKQEEALNSIAN